MISNRALIAGGVAAAVSAAAYARWGRRWVLNYGARDAEVARTLPGDEIVDDVALQTTRAITIDAEARDIWPWLVQMGPRPRAGAYTYDWIERLLGIDIESSDRILPEYQHLAAGEYLSLNEKGQGLQAIVVNAPHALVVQWVPARSTWAFVIEPDGVGRSRLLSRNRVVGSGIGFRLGMLSFMEAGSLAMERKMLLGIKQRAERLARDRIVEPNVPQPQPS
jgi:hypothetical protein